MKPNHELVEEFWTAVLNEKYLRGFLKGMGAPIASDGDFGYYDLADYLIEMAQSIKDAREPCGVRK